MKPHFLSFTASVTAMLVMPMFSSAQTKTLKLTEKNIDKIVASMTLEEKANMIVGMSRSLTDEETASIGYTKKIVPGAAGTTYSIPRFGITPMVFADGPAGLRISTTRQGTDRKFYCTGFPVGTLLSSTWNDDLVEKVGNALGDEVKEYGVDVLLAPGMNIMRNPLCGRNFEYYSEDPLLTGKIAAAYVRGLQSEGVGASIKHYAVNNQEINRLANDARVSERALREIYLKGFEIAVKESDPWTVMTSYNYVNGEYTSESYKLITDILRREWDFKGAVMTDWGGGLDAVKQVKVGNDMIQPGKNVHYETILAALKDGSLKESEIDSCVKRILQLVVKTPRYHGYKYSDTPDLEAHSKVGCDAAPEGMVLLRNDGTLPISKSSEIALFGIGSYDFIAGGKGAGDVNKPYVVDLKMGLERCGFTLNHNLDSLYSGWVVSEKKRLAPENSKRPWYVYHKRPEELKDADGAIAKSATSADVAIITISRNSSESYDRHIERDYLLHSDELSLIKTVSREFHAKGKKVAVILNICGIIEMESWQDLADAVLICWLPGHEGGRAVASVIGGEVSPSGHLPISIPVKYADVPSQNFPVNVPETGRNQSFEHYSKIYRYYDVPNIDYTDYDEDIYVGYRYYTTENVPVSYPFGFGLTYSKFSLSGLHIDRKSDELKVYVNVKNVGDFAAKQVVQVYVSAPQNINDRPSIELKGYCKTRELAPSESQEVVVTLPVGELAFWEGGENGRWTLPSGRWTIHVGTSSSDLPLSEVLNL